MSGRQPVLFQDNVHLSRCIAPGLLHAEAMAPDVLPPHVPLLLQEWHRWSWFPEAWAALPIESRDRYEGWVALAQSPRQARRRAGVVARRTYSGRPWAGRARRILQAFVDYAKQAPDMPDASHGTVSS